MPVPPDPRGIGQGFGAGKACFADVLIPGAAGESFRSGATWAGNAPIGLSRQGIPAALRAGRAISKRPEVNLGCATEKGVGFPCGEHAPQDRVRPVASKYVVARSVAKCLSDLRTVPVA